ncbi:flagellar biosynthetic protein FliO [Chelativorans salis]|uniref:Flagellar biosynthetic protein FliO n=1 Tax=Chelativorans salis TaxID=2978478 RepID=A0ABT2LM43_9HYPH|nr:flagellar biosynthetic protein FliO [Chelativorans sp. EGI FJ00035]MCT7375459.1 flagellar biosynthetic protein FliO [Chelativorans sp. EGI FJ00035]
MGEWLAGLAGENYVTAILWTLAALILLAIVLIVVRMVRNRASGTFVAGGRNRLPRLAVVDATAVDSQRRLVLVRRDDVEHLILIGGPSDLVIEPRIGARDGEPTMMQRPPRREAVAPSVPPPAPRPRPTPNLRAVTPASAPAAQRPVRSEPERPAAPPMRHAEPQPAPQSEPKPASAAGDGEEDAALAREIDVAVDEPVKFDEPVKKEAEEPSPQPQRANLSIEDEMSRLLDDLAEERKKGG